MELKESIKKRILKDIHLIGYFHFGALNINQRRAYLYNLIELGYLTKNMKLTPKGINYSLEK